MSLTANIAAFFFLFVIMLYTSNIYHIVLLCTNIWSSFDASDIILSEIEDLFLHIMNFLWADSAQWIRVNKSWSVKNQLQYCHISFNLYVPHHSEVGFVPNVTLVTCPKTFVRNLATKMRPNKGIEGSKSLKMGKGPPQFSRCMKP
jgi:hypothetical protein